MEPCHILGFVVGVSVSGLVVASVFIGLYAYYEVRGRSEEDPSIMSSSNPRNPGYNTGRRSAGPRCPLLDLYLLVGSRRVRLPGRATSPRARVWTKAPHKAHRNKSGGLRGV